MRQTQIATMPPQQMGMGPKNAAPEARSPRAIPMGPFDAASPPRWTVSAPEGFAGIPLALCSQGALGIA